MKFLLSRVPPSAIVFTALAAITAAAVAACSDDDFRCSDASFVPSCIDQTTARICTHGEVARWACSSGQVCDNGHCVDVAE